MTETARFNMAFVISLTAHCIVFIVLSFFAGSAPRADELSPNVIEIELADPMTIGSGEGEGGGGGGGGSPGDMAPVNIGDVLSAPESFVPQQDEAAAQQSAADEAQPEDIAVHSTAAVQGSQLHTANNDKLVVPRGVPLPPGVAGGTGGGGGSGGGIGTGSGTGIGSGSGTGIGSGSGGGYGSGHGDGVGSGTGSGGGVAPPAVLGRVEPNYPESARQAGVEGTVVVRIEILPSGAAGNVEVYESSGSAALDRAALDAVRQWRFIPAKRRSSGEAVACYTKMPVAFRLR